MTDPETPNYTPAAGLAVASAVVFTLAFLAGSNLVGFVSLFLAGMSAQSFIGSRRSRAGSSNVFLEARVRDLEQGLLEAQKEIRRLQDGQNFDRRLGSDE